MDFSEKKVAILGTGDAGRTLGQALHKAGYDVVYGSRNPVGLNDSLSSVTDHTGAVNHAEIIISTIPGQYTLEALESIGEEALAGKILVDVGVAFNDDFTVLIHQDISGGELIQEKFPATKVVKTFCTMTASIMVEPASLGEETTIFLSGNYADAKKKISYLLSDLGWSTSSQVDLGGIETARGQEHFAVLYFALASKYGHGEFNIKLNVKKNSGG
ncbi:NAD(P)-binding domain-containing protein [Leclercia adecarboxylata]|uniref:NADPH-dependent F420 reductase n=1 Tax=Leclercia adecarboxylata TaxID=83655 RepID=UPI002DB8D1FB|nr:NAD(P)-binding domain-containing protein [Leclercia adecarboxylata]MEB6377750.1 NAD(P)-binding domain-containing protein [Leclercia adecarboxylata]